MVRVRDRGDRDQPEVSVMYLLELARTIEADRRREAREGVFRQHVRDAMAAIHDESVRVVGVARGDRPGGRGDARADLGRREDLHPASRTEHVAGGLVRPVQAEPKP